MSAPRPNAGDEIAIEEPYGNHPQRVFHRPKAGHWSILDGAQADTSTEGEFSVKGAHKPNIYGPEQPWDVKVKDDDESLPDMRRGKVQG